MKRKQKREPKITAAQIESQTNFWRGAKYGFEMAATYLMDQAGKEFARHHDEQAKVLRHHAYEIRMTQMKAAEDKVLTIQGNAR